MSADDNTWKNESIRMLISEAIGIGFGVASVYFFYQHNYALAVVLLILTVMRILGIRYRDIGKPLDEILAPLMNTPTNHVLECNISLSIAFNVAEILKHECVAVLFQKLQSKGAIKLITKDDWIEALLKNFKDKFNKENNWERVDFNVKNNVVWKNGVVDFDDYIYHEIDIPIPDREESRMEIGFPVMDFLTDGLRIRLLLVNGILKLQVGRFPKELSPEILSKSGSYKEYETVTSFPLMYFQNALPKKYLNLTSYATESYWRGHGKGMFSDWRKVNKEVRDYEYVYAHNLYKESSVGRLFKITEASEKKRNEWLGREGFKEREPFGDYTNKYLDLYIDDRNDERDRLEEHVFCDYDRGF